MSASVAAAGRGAAGTTSARPATTRVTVLTGKRMTDLVLPAAAPMETYIDETVAVLADLLADTPADVLAGFDFSAQGVWTFARPGAAPLPLERSLDDAGVVDGSLLTLVSASRTERYRPLVEDVSDAIAVLDDSPEFDRSALYRFAAVALPVLMLPITAAALRAWWVTGRGQLWPAVLGLVGIGLLMGSVAANRFYKNAGFSEGLLLAAYPLVGGAVAMAIPLPRGQHALGAPQLAGAAAVVLFLTLATRGGPRRRALLGSFIAVSAIAVTAAAVATGYGYQRWVAAGAIALGLFIVTNAARLTVAVARIALPPIPVPGEAEHTDGDTETWRAIIASVPASAVRLTERSRLAKQLLIGHVTAGALVLAAGAVTVVVRGHFFAPTVITALLVAVVCGFRSRLYAERWCAWALLAAAVAIPTGLAVRLCGWYPHSAWLILAGYLAAVMVALMVVGATSQVRRVSPVLRRLLELIDGVAVASTIPMLLWITGVYDMVRNIRF